jgi:hypothetical protein
MTLRDLSPPQYGVLGIFVGCFVLLLAYRYLTPPLVVYVRSGVAGLYTIVETTHHEGWFFDTVSVWVDPVHVRVFPYRQYYLRQVIVEYAPTVTYLSQRDSFDVVSTLFGY